MTILRSSLIQRVIRMSFPKYIRIIIDQTN